MAFPLKATRGTEHPIISLLRLVLCVTWFLAGFVKLQNPYLFLDDVIQYRLVGFGVALLIATILPVMEISLAAAIGTRFCLPFAAGLSSLLLTVFLVAQSSAVIRQLDISCGCFSSSIGGQGGGVVDYFTLLRTGALLAISLFLTIRTFKSYTRLRDVI
ncbi:MAG: MauE/DoxX family redox-associated membrane protein [Sumerlaeia bacterium]